MCKWIWHYAKRSRFSIVWYSSVRSISFVRIERDTHFDCSISSNGHHELFDQVVIRANSSLSYIIERSQGNGSRRRRDTCWDGAQDGLTLHFSSSSCNHCRSVEHFHNLTMEVSSVSVNMRHRWLDRIFGNDATNEWRGGAVDWECISFVVPVSIRSASVTTSHGDSKRMATGISDNDHFPAILVFRYVWHSAAIPQYVHQRNRWVRSYVTCCMRCQPNDRDGHSTPKPILDELPRPTSPLTCQSYRKITIQTPRPTLVFQCRLSTGNRLLETDQRCCEELYLCDQRELWSTEICYQGWF